MGVYLIVYDLRDSDHDYDGLHAALAAINAKRVHESVWGVNTSSSADGVFEHLWQHMHSGRDRLFVIPFDKSCDYRADNSVHMLKDI